MTQVTPLTPVVRYADAIEAEVVTLTGQIEAVPELREQYYPRWLAVQLLEGEESLLDNVAESTASRVELAVARSRARLEANYGTDTDIALADDRYRFVHQLVDEVMVRPDGPLLNRSDRIDQILTHPWLGIPILLGLMYVVFNLVQTVSAPYLDWIDGVFGGILTQWVVATLNWLNSPAWLVSLVADGIIAGVGGVLVFLPGLLVMYFSLAFLEASGYMARAAFVMDRAMNVLGLQGRSFVPMILGFGCNVPAIYATRTIENRAARLLTGLLIPFMSCSARLPIYVIFGLAFFPNRANIVIWGMYVAGVLVAAAVGIFLSSTLFREAAPDAFVMEMPPYQVPTFREMWTYTRLQSASFVRKAGSFILIVSILFWALLNLPWGVESSRDSLFGQASEAISPVFEPAGFGTWEASGALISGILAKEVIISTMSQIYIGPGEGVASDSPSLFEGIREVVIGFSAATVDAGRQLLEMVTPGFRVFGEAEASPETALTLSLQETFSPLAAIAFILFVLLYIPCVATLGAQIQEFGWRWALLSATLMLAVPWLIAVSVYQGGRLLGLA